MHGSTPLSIIPPELLLKAYRTGIFPMADSRDDPEVFWVEPRMRAIMPIAGLHISHSLKKTLRKDRFRVTCNAAFDQVIEACAGPRAGADESWISERIMASYCELARLGHAHSLECWEGEELVGGLYGVGFGRVFCGESMFSRRTDSSKVAMAWLVAALRRGGAELLDCQFITPHLASLGAVEIPQGRYLALLRTAQRPLAEDEGFGLCLGLGLELGFADGLAPGEGDALPSDFGAGLLPAGFGALLADAAASGLSSSPGNFIAQFLTHTS
jgi:leucyl/phenylalanyl-tRNA--protein transferase